MDKLTTSRRLSHNFRAVSWIIAYAIAFWTRQRNPGFVIEFRLLKLLSIGHTSGHSRAQWYRKCSCEFFGSYTSWCPPSARHTQWFGRALRECEPDFDHSNSFIETWFCKSLWNWDYSPAIAHDYTCISFTWWGIKPGTWSFATLCWEFSFCS